MTLHYNQLTAAQAHLYKKRFEQPGHDWRVYVDLLNKQDEVLVSFDQGAGGGRDVTVTDGGIVMRGPKRLLRLTVADPGKVLSVAQDGHFVDRQLRVQLGMWVPALQDEVICEAFHGPIWRAPREGDLIVFRAHGREQYAEHGILDTYIVKAGTKVTAAIRQILIDLAGEDATHLGQIPDLAPVLKEDLVLHEKSSVLQTVLDLAESVGRYLSWGGDGDVEMPRLDTTDPDVTFTGGGDPESPDAHLIDGRNGPPKVEVSQGDVRNAIHVTGGTTKGTHRPPVGEAICDNEHFPGFPFTVEEIGAQWLYVDAPQYKKQDGVDTAARNILLRNIRGVQHVEFEIIPVPWLRYGMPCAISTPEAQAQFNLTHFGEIPLFLAGGATMSIGFHKRASADRFAGRS